MTQFAFRTSPEAPIPKEYSKISSPLRTARFFKLITVAVFAVLILTDVLH
jgi:hypothetical protein